MKKKEITIKTAAIKQKVVSATVDACSAMHLNAWIIAHTHRIEPDEGVTAVENQRWNTASTLDANDKTSRESLTWSSLIVTLNF